MIGGYGKSGHADGGDDDDDEEADGKHSVAVFQSSVPAPEPTSPSADSHAAKLIDEGAVWNPRVPPPNSGVTRTRITIRARTGGLWCAHRYPTGPQEATRMPEVQNALTRHQAPPPPRRHGWRIVFVLFSVFTVVVLGVAAVTVWNLSRSFESVEKISEAFPADETARPPAATGAAASAMNILLLGSDSRGDSTGSIANLSGQRSDTIVIVHVPADRKTLSVMSIPRDSWLEIPGYGEAKINAALSYGGVPLAVQTVEGLLGSRIDHVAVVDFAGFAALTDALGGVDIDNPIPFESYHLSGRTFPQGLQHLNGTEALAFARERYAFADGDFQRVRNQQLLISALLSGLMHKSVLGNPTTMGGVIEAVSPNLAIDEELSATDLVTLGVELRDVREGDVSFFTIPTAGTGTSADGQSIVNLDWAALPALQEAYRSDSLSGVVPAVQAAG
ncbi:LCP family protein [Cryobacterium sp. TMB1-7]|uniref:LCP family protein n=1 Tax=Cryobacterium sp. TMB1-7 TaxID=2555866 RepID=UPI00141BEC8F|nr:LCP family protein [Cryobacterium sp. TMB1-7]